MGWIEKAQKVYQERGYLVIGRFTPYRIGAVITVVNLPDKPNVRLPQPFYVIAETTREDYLAQHRLAETMLSPEYDDSLAHFYRIMTD